MGAVATHNSIHCKVFENAGGNTFLRFALTLWYGHPCSTFVPGHNLSHHRYTQMVNDLMQTSVVQYTPNILNLMLFHPNIVGRVLRSDIVYMLWMGKKGRRMFNDWLSEVLMLIAVTVVLLYISPRKWFYYFMAPHYVAQFSIVTINLLQHDGCDIVLPRLDEGQHDGDMYDDHMRGSAVDAKRILVENALPESTPFAPAQAKLELSSERGASAVGASGFTATSATVIATSSAADRKAISAAMTSKIAPTFQQRVSSFNTARNFVSPQLNWLLMNNGYHTIHHHRPYLHWSLLPEAHAREVKPHIHPALDQPSMFGYIFNQYVSPGIRTDYLGRPVTFDRTMDESANGDWMNMPTEDKESITVMSSSDRLRFVADGMLVVLLKLVSPIYSPFAKMD